jgi:hypothetical protein
MDARDFVVDLLSGVRSHVDDRAPRRSRRGNDSADDVLRKTKEALEHLEQLRDNDPAEALELLRGLLMDASLTDHDLRQFLDVYWTAVDDPDAFEQRVATLPRGGPADWWDALRAYLHRPTEPDGHERDLLANLAKTYVFPNHVLAPPVNPHERVLEVLDPAWVPLAKAKYEERFWPQGLVSMPRHSSERPFVYDALGPNREHLAPGTTHQIALIADFGTGYYHTWGIAEQIATWKPSYTFHLGDVYYGGDYNEFVDRFELPLFDVVERTHLMGLAENHELYAGGEPYLAYFRQLSERGRTQQEGSYFCVRFPRHQVIGIDVNWQGRQRFVDSDMREWLRDRIIASEGRTNVLLTGSAPFVHGEMEACQLLEDLRDFVRSGEIGLWFWGNDHYGALFDRHDPDVPFFGSCIGHGGYPGRRPREWLATYTTRPLWVEDQPRFPVWSKLREDVTNSGWCHATLRPDGGIDLLYVDWLWCKRMSISLTPAAVGLRANTPTFFERDTSPQIHRPM